MILLSSLAEAVGHTIVLLDSKLSKKTLLIQVLAVASVMCCCVAFIPVDQDDDDILSWTKTAIILATSITKCMVTAAINLAYLYASEIYPTNIRNTMISNLSSIGRIGAIIAPQINLLGSLVWSPLPYLVFSLSSFLGSLFVIILPQV